MPAATMHLRHREETRSPMIWLWHALTCALVLVTWTNTIGVIQAADCPPAPQQHIPQAPPGPLNIDKIKVQLLDYQSREYDNDVAAVFANALSYVEQRARQVTNPAIVLDIDETSLSNWMNIKANDFSFISEGPCDRLPVGPCGFKEWILKSVAPAIKPALNLFNTATSKHVAAFFITSRRDKERQATMWNLDRGGFGGWAKLITRPDNATDPSIQPFKTEERAKIAAAGYTIIANVGDQDSDLAGGFAECAFKVPNPFYFIP